MSLLSENDFRALQTALQRMDEFTLTRTLGGCEISAGIIPVGKAWPVAMDVQIRCKRARMEWVQIFESVEMAREAIG